MKILICGDRKWDALEVMKEQFRYFHYLDIIIHGDANGADAMADELARARRLVRWIYPANWDLMGRSAGPTRNIRMLKEGQPDLVLAFHDDLAISSGTRHMVNLAVKAEIQVRSYKSNGTAGEITKPFPTTRRPT